MSTIEKLLVSFPLAKCGHLAFPLEESYNSQPFDGIFIGLSSLRIMCSCSHKIISSLIHGIFIEVLNFANSDEQVFLCLFKLVDDPLRLVLTGNFILMVPDLLDVFTAILKERFHFHQSFFCHLLPSSLILSSTLLSSSHSFYCISLSS